MIYHKKCIDFFCEHIYDLFFSVLLGYSLLLRLCHLGPNYFASDFQRDYLIANHIVRFGDKPQFGPNNSIFGNAVLPVYNYLTAAFLLIKNSGVFLNFVNILLQVLVLLFLYLIAKKMFSARAAFMGLVLCCFSLVILKWSVIYFQPFVAGFFTYFSYLLLLLAYQRKSFPLLAVGVYIFVFGLTLHSSSIALIPLVAIVSMFILKRIPGKRLLQVLILTLPALIICLGSYSPLLSASANISSKFITSPGQFFSNLESICFYFFGSIFNFSFSIATVGLNGFSPVGRPVYIFPIEVFLFTIILIVAYFSSTSIHRTRKHFAFILVAAISSVLIIMSLLVMKERGFWQFTPVYGLYLILLGEVIDQLFQTKFYLVALKYFIVVLLATLLAYNPLSFHLHSVSYAVNIVGQQELLPATAIIKKVQSLGNNYIDIEQYVYRSGQDNEVFISNAYYWTQLENTFHRRFVELSPQSFSGFRAANIPQYIFLVCPWQHQADCQKYFAQQYPDYQVSQDFYADSNWTIALASSNAQKN